MGGDLQADLDAAIGAGDLRFLAVAGFVVEVPGVVMTRKNGFIVWWYGQRTIEGTSDVGPSLAFQVAARQYAETYNSLLLDYLARRRFPRWFQRPERR